MSITTKQEYEAALIEVESFFKTPPVPGTPEAERFVELIKSIEAYEDEHYPIEGEAPVVMYEINGIKCDTDGCEFRDDAVTVDDYPEWLNRPCPSCGANLLTEADYDMVQKFIFYADTLNEIAAGGGLGFDRITDVNASNVNHVELDLDGSGQPKFK